MKQTTQAKRDWKARAATWFAPVAGVVLVACAPVQLDQDTLLDTQAAISAAEEIDSGQEPDVELHIEYAREQINTAKQLASDGKRYEAERTLERALADAELARAMARTQMTQAKADEAWNEVRALQQ